MEEMVSQLSVMVEDLKVERRYALSTLASRRIREAADAVELARRLVSAAVNVGESDVRRRMDETLLSRATIRAEAVADIVAAEADARLTEEADRLAEAAVEDATSAVGVAEDAVDVDNYYATLRPDPGIQYDYQGIR